jgi:hypothetical protein
LRRAIVLSVRVNSLHAPRAPPPAGKVRLILSSKNLNENTGLIHLAGTELAPIVGFYQTAGWGGSRGFCESEAHANVRPKASREKNIQSDRTLFR